MGCYQQVNKKDFFSCKSPNELISAISNQLTLINIKTSKYVSENNQIQARSRKSIVTKKHKNWNEPVWKEFLFTWCIGRQIINYSLDCMPAIICSLVHSTFFQTNLNQVSRIAVVACFLFLGFD